MTKHLIASRSVCVRPHALESQWKSRVCLRDVLWRAAPRGDTTLLSQLSNIASADESHQKHSFCSSSRMISLLRYLQESIVDWIYWRYFYFICCYYYTISTNYKKSLRPIWVMRFVDTGGIYMCVFKCYNIQNLYLLHVCT